MKSLSAATVVLTLLLGESVPSDSAAASGALKSLADVLLWDSDFATLLKDFYAARSYEPAWIVNGEPTAQAKAIIQVLESASAKGLCAADYDAGLWTGRVASLRKGGLHTSAHDAARFDIELTISLARYVAHVSLGRANPGIFLTAQDIQQRIRSSRDLLEGLTHSTRVAELLSSVEPKFPGYQRTLAALRLYTAMAGDKNGPLLTSVPKPVQSGSNYTGLPELVQRLIRLGDLSPHGAAGQSGELYEGAVVDAVKRFQMRHGLEPNGFIDASTVAELNTPMSKRVRQLQLTLERYRWVPYKPGRKQIVVNIPEFRLRGLTESYAPEIELKVVVGRAYRHQTPVFWSDLKHVIFRPYWNVPSGIQRVELVPKLRKDTAYLVRNHYEVVDAGNRVITRTALNDDVLSQLRTGKLRLRQAPGVGNALGLVKFVFPNHYNVYLHDTPARNLFSRSRRDFSHGCIRVENPENLAQWLLSHSQGWTRERIVEAMHGVNTMQVDLDTSVPVLIVYATAVVLQTGEVRFFRDIYGHDAALEESLATCRPTVSRTFRGISALGSRDRQR